MWCFDCAYTQYEINLNYSPTPKSFEVIAPILTIHPPHTPPYVRGPFSWHPQCKPRMVPFLHSQSSYVHEVHHCSKTHNDASQCLL